MYEGIFTNICSYQHLLLPPSVLTIICSCQHLFLPTSTLTTICSYHHMFLQTSALTIICSYHHLFLTQSGLTIMFLPTSALTTICSYHHLFLPTSVLTNICSLEKLISPQEYLSLNLQYFHDTDLSRTCCFFPICVTATKLMFRAVRGEYSVYKKSEFRCFHSDFRLCRPCMPNAQPLLANCAVTQTEL
jgi:hypothetical protein